MGLCCSRHPRYEELIPVKQVPFVRYMVVKDGKLVPK